MSVRLFVGNLPYDAKEAELRELFAPVGQLSYVTFPMDRETGKPRGFAFVDFGDRAQADDAIRRFNGYSFKGRTLAVNEARARENRPATAGPRFNSRPASPMMPRRPSGADQPVLGPMSDEMAPRTARRNRNFGPDAKPKRGRRDERWVKGEGGKRGPIPVRGGGRLYGNLDDDSYESEPEEDDDLLLQEDTGEEDQAM
jgi:RNA recognition motif-containing protein